jgi:hypothetical protein
VKKVARRFGDGVDEDGNIPVAGIGVGRRQAERAGSRPPRARRVFMHENEQRGNKIHV